MTALASSFRLLFAERFFQSASACFYGSRRRGNGSLFPFRFMVGDLFSANRLQNSFRDHVVTLILHRTKEASSAEARKKQDSPRRFAYREQSSIGLALVKLSCISLKLLEDAWLFSSHYLPDFLGPFFDAGLNTTTIEPPLRMSNHLPVSICTFLLVTALLSFPAFMVLLASTCVGHKEAPKSHFSSPHSAHLDRPSPVSSHCKDLRFFRAFWVLTPGSLAAYHLHSQDRSQ